MEKEENTQMLLQIMQIRGKRFLQCIQKCKHLPWDFPQMGQSTRTYLERKYVY